MELLTGNKVLTKRQCDVLRGVAIIGIFVHNFCHWLNGSHHENEYLFFKEHSMRMWDYWKNVFSGNFDGFEFIQFFSFFGPFIQELDDKAWHDCVCPSADKISLGRSAEPRLLKRNGT